jgi:hypothetical protein
MPTVRDDNTGEQVEVTPVHAVAAVSITSSVGYDMPSNASQIIEQAMIGAAKAAMESGVTDPDKIRAMMLKARESAKGDMRHSWGK